MSAKKGSVTKTVKGGWVKRDAASGRLIAVGTSEGVTKATSKTEAVVKGVSSRRGAALKRLADR